MRGTRTRRGIVVGMLGIALIGANPVASTAQEASANAPKTGELPERRTPNSRTVRNADGSLTTSVFGAPVHYRDAGGQLQPIDNTLVKAAPGAPFAWRNRANAFLVEFRGRAGGDHLRLQTAGRGVRMSLRDAAWVAGEPDGTRVAYKGARPSTDLVYDVTGSGVKETLVLHDRTAPQTFTFHLAAEDGGRLLAEPMADGRWEVSTSAGGDSLFVLEPPRLRDSDGAGNEVPDRAPNARMLVTAVDDGLSVSVAVDPAWVAAPSRRFPLLLDPTITVHPSLLDAVLDANCPTCTVTTDNQRLDIGTSNTAAWRSLMQFDLGDIPTAATLTKAEVQLYFDDTCINTATTSTCAASVPHTFNVHRVSAPWSGASTSQQIAFDPTVVGSSTVSNANDKWMAWDVTQTVRDWVTGVQTNFGLLFKRATEPAGAGGVRPPGRNYPEEPSLVPKLVVTYSGDGVDLLSPDTLHSNGAELRWTKYEGLSGAPFQRYEVHRSATAGFTPSPTTLVATIADVAVTSYRDTTAAPSRAFSYRVVANTSASNERRVTLPADGRATKVIQPSVGTSADTFIVRFSSAVVCYNHGRRDRLDIGANSNSTRRPMLRFDLRDIPTGATVESATMSLWHPVPRTDLNTIAVHRVTRDWPEGTGVSGTCTGDGPTWYDTASGVKWTTEGGDVDSNAVATHTSTGPEPDDWHDFGLTALTQQWVNGEVPNHGVLLRLANETPGLYTTFRYWSADFTVAPTLRPKMVVSYADGSRATGPVSSVTAPAAGAVVSGNAATVSATASDDRRVDKVELLVDGVVRSTHTAEPYAFDWDTTTATTGTHTLSVRATDDAGNVTTSSPTSVTVDNSAAPTTSVSAPTGNAYGSAVAADAPRGYWRLGEASGATTAADSSGNGHAGTYRTAAPGVPGALAKDGNGAAAFPGTAEGVDVVVPDHDRLDFGTGDFSVEAWVKTTSNGERAIVGKNSGSGANWRVTVTDDAGFEGRVRAAISDGTTTLYHYGPTIRVDDGNWHHVAVVFMRDTGTKVYVDGEKLATDGVISASVSNASTLTIGDTQGHAPFVGEIDDVAVYATALSLTRVLAHYNAGIVTGTTTIDAQGADDRGVTNVELYVDGMKHGDDASAPYSFNLDTLATASPVYDGVHVITTKAYDAAGQVTTSAPVVRTVANAAGTAYRTAWSTTAVPGYFSYDPTLPAQQQSGIDVSVTNRSLTAWSSADMEVRYRWIPSDGGPSVDGTGVLLGGVSVQPGATKTARLMVVTPTLADGVDRAQYTLRIDLYERSTGTWFASRGNPPNDNPVVVNRALRSALGIERYYQYESEPLGAGMAHLTNVATGNSLVRWTPFTSPGRGLSTVVGLTYNSLEQHSESPVGSNFSLAVSSLVPLGSRLDVHPNKADDIAGRANRWIEFTDGDGTTHRFEGKQAADGTVYWEEPAGLHLYLREFSATDPAKKWALTRPDRVTFFFDADGYPTGVEDANANRLDFTLSPVAPGEDPGGVSKRITRVTDAAGLGTGAAQNRSFDITYYGRQDVKKASGRGRVKRITDHDGSAVEFDYYEDGNLLRIREKGGRKADGSILKDRSFVFTYTTSAGDGPAIPVAGDRERPDPRTPNQSTKLFSVRDPRGKETTFSYYGPTSSQLRWKLKTRTNRVGKTTSYAYDIAALKTTITAPMSRVSSYQYDSDGKVTAITLPNGQTTTLAWTADRHVARMTEPTNAYVEFGYNANGYLTDRWDQLRNRTSLEYENLPLDANDTAGRWKATRSIPHSSRLVKKTQPKGTATPSPDNDFQWTFGYDDTTRSNLKTVTDPGGFTTTYERYTDGAVKKVINAKGHATTFTYDRNGLVESVTDARGAITRFGYDDDGAQLWAQDANHAANSGGTPSHYRTEFFYDSFGRLGRQSTPKSTAKEPGMLLWAAIDYDENDNPVLDVAPQFGEKYPGTGARTTAIYDDMDRPKLVTGPDTSADPLGERHAFEYDDAGRLVSRTSPRGVQTTHTTLDFAEFYKYDLLDRVERTTRHAVDGSGNVTETHHTHVCFDAAGDMRRITAPKADLATVDCNGAPPAHTTRYDYDIAHRPLTETDPEGRSQSSTYDENGNVKTRTDAEGATTTVFYDGRDLPERVVEPFTTGRQLTTKIKYDATGNQEHIITPRAWDASADKANFTQYVTTIEYDELDRVARVKLPTNAAYPTQLYMHKGYDAVGNLATSTLTDDSPTLGGVEPAKVTTVAHFDPGWVRSTKEGDSRAILFAYTAEGLQAERAPELPTGEPDPAQKMLWSYYVDGQLKSNKDREGHGTDYTYDADGNLLTASGDSGVVAPTESRLDVEAFYDGFGRVSKARAKKRAETNWRFTKTGYDRNGNVKTREDDGVETTSGVLVSAGRSLTFGYDGADWLTTMTDFGATAATSDDQLVETVFWPTGREKDRKISKAGALGAWTLKQHTTWDYFINGKLKTLATKNGAGAVLESHTVGYDDAAGVYANGHRTKDTYTLAGPNASAACRTTPCTAIYTYDAQDRLVREDNGHGTVTEYSLDDAGNIKSEKITKGGASATKVFEYSGNRLVRTSGVGPARRYHHDAEGNLDCVTTDAGSLLDCNQPTGVAVSARLVADHHYDYLNRMDSYRSYNTDGTTSTADDTTDYVLDALDRVVEQTEKHGPTGTPRTTRFGYVGLSGSVSQETQSTGSTVTDTKTYAYDAFGHRIAMTNDPGAPGPTGGATEDFSYAYDVHGSVSLLLSNTTSAPDHGAARASYGYRPYGEADADLTHGDTDADKPFNPYRYTGKRLDSGSGTLDMGARRFGPDTARFLQMDRYNGALADLSLSTDPLTGNRWSLAGGNPVGYIEVDGHNAKMDGTGGAGTLTPDQIEHNKKLMAQMLAKEKGDCSLRCRAGRVMVGSLKAYLAFREGTERVAEGFAQAAVTFWPVSSRCGVGLYEECAKKFWELTEPIRDDPGGAAKQMAKDVVAWDTFASGDIAGGLGELSATFATGVVGRAAMGSRAVAGVGRSIPRSERIPHSLGAASRAEQLARKLHLNVDSPTTRQVLNSLDDSVADFVGNYRKGSIWRELPGEVTEMSVEEALQHSPTVRKLLIDNRFVK